jgi:coenzyme F420-dependent glucose-6-phosphate dehydrogenase
VTQFGYSLASEEHRPLDLVRQAAQAEESGFDFAAISDHYHPWLDAQGQSAFIWTVLGGIATATDKLRVGTGVTCPIIRYHPALVAQMAATAASMMEGRFFLGIGSGENLNEHVYGDHFPPPVVRQEMLLEAVEIIRELWEGEEVTHHGEFYAVEEACLYTLPSTLPEIYMAADGPRAAEIAGQVCDGLISVSPEKEIISSFEKSGGKGKPRMGQVAVCYAKSEAEARRTAHHYWALSGLQGDAKWEIRSTKHFDGLVKGVSEDQVAESILCSPDPEKHAQHMQPFIDAGYDHVFVHQIGPDQDSFFKFYRDEVLPFMRKSSQPARKSA